MKPKTHSNYHFFLFLNPSLNFIYILPNNVTPANKEVTRISKRIP